MLFRATRAGHESKPSTEVRLTLESYGGARFAAWSQWDEGASKPKKLISIRKSELAPLRAALREAETLWARNDTEFTSHMGHAEYAALLDWG